MSISLPYELLSALNKAIHSTEENILIEQVGGGLINRSYRVTHSATGRSFFLQAINTKVFLKPEDVQHNYISLYEFSRSDAAPLNMAAPLYWPNGLTLFIDEDNIPWRAFEWIPNSMTIAAVGSAEQAKEVAETFAGFTLFFSRGFDPSVLRETIPHFHDLSLRYRQFESAFENTTEERKEHSADIVVSLTEREHYRDQFEMIKASRQKFPLRVMHHDAKIANIIFTADSGKVWGPVDLDTVMPGYFFSDLGDMIRSLAGSIEENDTGFSAMYIREDIYAALVDGYSAVMEKEWTREEMANRHLSGLLLVYMQALRFITDHLNGDIYYQVSYPGQNFDRAKNQLTLLEKLEEFIRKKYGFKV